MNLAYLAISMVPSDKIRGEIISIIKKMYARNELNTRDLKKFTNHDYYDQLKNILSIETIEGKIKNKILEAVSQLFSIQVNIFKQFNSSFIGEEIKEQGFAFEALLTPLNINLESLIDEQSSLLSKKKVFILKKTSKKKILLNPDLLHILQLENIITKDNQLTNNLDTLTLTTKLTSLVNHHRLKLEDLFTIKKILLEEISLYEYAKKIFIENNGTYLPKETNLYRYLKLQKINPEKYQTNATMIQNKIGFNLCLGDNIFKTLLAIDNFSFGVDFLVYHEVLEIYYKNEYKLDTLSAHEKVLNDSLHILFFSTLFRDIAISDIPKEKQEPWLKINKHYQYLKNKNEEDTKEERIILNNDIALWLELSTILDTIINLLNIQGVRYDGKKYSMKKLITKVVNLEELFRINGIINNGNDSSTEFSQLDILLPSLMNKLLDFKAKYTDEIIMPIFLLDQTIQQVYGLIDVYNMEPNSVTEMGKKRILLLNKEKSISNIKDLCTTKVSFLMLKKNL
ncbi:MAG: hypothetical protein GY830_05465 [Bacteroidetes bacterium]|nr:hypothetical protein [Bacteroidota bacterium]